MVTKENELTQEVTSFLTSGPKGLLIDGQFVPAASGKTFETINPATGEELAQVAEGDKEDVEDRAAQAS